MGLTRGLIHWSDAACGVTSRSDLLCYVTNISLSMDSQDLKNINDLLDRDVELREVVFECHCGRRV